MLAADACVGPRAHLPMQAIPHIVALTSPLFLLAGIGYALVRWFEWPEAVSDALTRFVFALPCRRCCSAS